MMKQDRPGGHLRRGTLKATLSSLFLKTLDRVALKRVVPEKVKCCGGVLRVGSEEIDTYGYRRIVIISIGKAAFEMASLMLTILPPNLAPYGVASGASFSFPDRKAFSSFRAGHPYPNRQSLSSADAVLRVLSSVTSNDLVIHLLSGGGSALCEKPVSPVISLDDLVELNRLLITCGAPIIDVNFVRKHLSLIKGGRLAEAAYPARQITLYVSDAPPGNPSNVASGPTMPDESTVEDCRKILSRWNLFEQLPPSVRRLFEENMVPETPKPGARIFENNSWHCLLEPEDAAAALADEARLLGWKVEIDGCTGDDWPLERTSRHLLSRLESMRSRSPNSPVAVVAAGEYSCPVRGAGVGGRNQAFVLDCVPRISARNIAVLSAGTDGRDGISPAAGAVADGDSFHRASHEGLSVADFARRSDSYNFFNQLGDVVLTGPTGNNVRDLRILVAW